MSQLSSRDITISILVKDLEGEVFDVSLDFSVAKSTTDKSFGVEDGVVGVHRDLILGGVADESLIVGEGDIGWCRSVSLVVGDDLDSIVLPDTNARVGCAKVNADSF